MDCNMNYVSVLRNSIMCDSHFAILWSVGSANNLDQEYPDYLDALVSKAKTVGKTVLVIICDPDMEPVPLFTKKCPFAIAVTDTHTEYVHENLKFLVFKEYFNVTQYSLEPTHMALLRECIDMCMVTRTLCLYCEYSGQDNYVLQEQIHDMYRDDPRFLEYIDLGSVSGHDANGQMTSSCMLNSCPIFACDFSRLFPIDSMPIADLEPFIQHPRTRDRFLRSVDKILNNDCVALRQYVAGDPVADWIRLYICERNMFNGEFSYEPFNMVRDRLLLFAPMLEDETQKMMYECTVQDIVNMTKDNRYEWMNGMKAFMRCVS